MEWLFNEELGLVVEVDDAKVGEVLAAYEAVQVPARVIAKTQVANRVSVSVNGAVVVDEDEKALHDLWEATSFELDKLQSNSACAEQEQECLMMAGWSSTAWRITLEGFLLKVFVGGFSNTDVLESARMDSTVVKGSLSLLAQPCIMDWPVLIAFFRIIRDLVDVN